MVFLLLAALPAAHAADFEHVWSKSFGDWNWQFGLDAATDAADNTIITGAFFGTVNFGGGSLTSAGGHDIYLAKFASNGHHMWSKRFGDTSDWQQSQRLAVDPSGNIVVAGLFLGTVDFGGGPLTSAGLMDAFVVKFDPDGNHIWSKRFGDTSDYQTAQSVATDASGNVVIVGYFEGTVDFGGGSLTSAGSRDIFVAKFAPDGTHVWSDRYGDSDSQEPADVAVDNLGNILMTGFFLGEVNFGGDLLINPQMNDIFLVKFDPSGNHVWSKSFNVPDEQIPTGIDTDNDGNVFIAGIFNLGLDFGGELIYSMGYQDIFLAKFDSNGDHVWSKGFGNNSNYEHARAIAVDDQGNVIIAGEIWLTVDFGGGGLTSAGYIDIFAAMFDPDGDYLWSRRFGDTSDLQTARCISVGASGDITLIGDFLGTVDFGGVPLENDDGLPTYLDIFVAKLAPLATGVHDPAAESLLSVEAYPNPFNPTTTITYTLPAPGLAKVKIYDVRGRLLQSLIEKINNAGTHAATWNGRDSVGQPAASGIYFVRVEFGGLVETEKIVLLK